MASILDFIANKNKGESFDVFIGRGSIYGNLWSHMKNTAAEFHVGTRDEACDNYRDWLLGISFHDVYPEVRLKILNSLPSLKSKILGCYCKGVGRCHGETLVRLSNLF